MGISNSKQRRQTPPTAAPPSSQLNQSHHSEGPNNPQNESRVLGGGTHISHGNQHINRGRMVPMHDPNNDTGEMIQLFMYHKCPRSIVHHYIPANLPMMPIFTEIYLTDCNNTWKYILSSSTDRMKEFQKSGIVLFYDEFFFRLFQRDSTFKDVFPDVRRRGEILIKALSLMLKSSTDDNARLVNKIRYLGHRHRFYPKIRAFQFATYTSTLIEVIMYWLGELATPDVAEAWSNVVCFFMKHMLESFLTDRVDPYESYQNTVIEHMRALSEIDDEDKKRPESSRASRASNSRAAGYRQSTSSNGAKQSME